MLSQHAGDARVAARCVRMCLCEGGDATDTLGAGKDARNSAVLMPVELLS